jgi:hypothetical protein
VDYQGNPLAVQPHLEVDPTDHTQVKATSLDGASIPVEVYHPQKDFFVHVEASGLADEHGRPQYAATAVDANGQPLSIQPHLEVDPLDPTQVTAKFPDGSSYEPPNLYPPAGEQPDVWPPPADETSGEVEQDEADEDVEDTEEAVTADEEDPESFEAEKSYAGVELEEGPVAQDDDWNDEEAAGTTEDGLPAAGVDSASEGIRAETTDRADEETGPSPTERSESPEAEGMPVAEPEELVVEGLTTVSDQPEAGLTEPDEAAFKFFRPAEPAGEEIEVEVLEIDALVEPAPTLEEEPVESPSGERRPVVEVEALEIADQAMVAGLDETETPTRVAEPIETAAAPTELEPLEQVGSLSAFDTVPPLGEAAVRETPVEAVQDLTMPIEETEGIELNVLFEPVEPLEAGMELIEVEELDGGLPGDRYSQSVPEDPEPEEEQQT